MKKYFDLLKTEYIKNMNFKKFIVILIILILSSLSIFKLSEKNYINSFNYRNSFTISENVIENDKQSYEKSKINFNADKNYENYIEMMRLEKFVTLRETMYKKGYIDQLSNMAEVYNIILELNNTLPEYESIINGYKEYANKDVIENKYAQLKEKYDVALNVLETKKIYELRKLDLIGYQEKLEQLEQESSNSKDRLIEYKIYYYNKEIKLINYLVSKKITIDDWQYALSTYIDFYLTSCLISIPTEEEMDNNYYGFNSYDDYVNSYVIEIEKAKKNANLLFTALDFNIRPIIKTHNPSNANMLYDIKIGFNNIYYMGLVILVITCISLGGIVAHEHKTGSIRLLLANPFNRRKVLLSKYTYLILNALIMYLLSLLIFIIIVFVTGNIESLKVSQLIIDGNSLIQTNYLLFIIKNMTIHFIFMCLVLTAIFFVSTLFLNVSFTVGIATSVIIISSFLPIVAVNKLNSAFSYIPIIFLNYANYMSNNPIYNLLQEEEHNTYSNVNINTSLMVSIILIVVMLLICSVVYKKRDIKN